MAVELGTIDHLSQVISQVVAPSFLLGAVASFISMLFARMSTVVGRIRELNAIADDDPERGWLKADIMRLRTRTKLMHWSIMLAIFAGITTTLLIVAAFSAAMLKYQHIEGSAALFIISLAFFCGSLVLLGMDVARSVTEYDHY